MTLRRVLGQCLGCVTLRSARERAGDDVEACGVVMARRQTVRDREVCVDEMDVARRPLEEFSEPAQQGADRSVDCIDVVTSTVQN